MSETKPLISVIVPIYNVEKYVRKCLDSLKNQTMKQIEVICIDDGSTDESGKIAEEYKNKEGWPRFRVIHTENRGLSAARNRGIDEARSDWLMFVDSDDWVETGFCEVPYRAGKKNSADLVIFGSTKMKETTANGSGCVIDEFTAHECGAVVAWNKLYKKDLFKIVRYPEGRVFEDSATTHKLVHKAKCIVYLQMQLYHHVYRKDSISRSHTIANQREYFLSTIERNNDLVSYGYSKGRHNAFLCVGALGLLSAMDPCDDELYQHAIDVIKMTKGVPKAMNFKQKLAMIAWRYNRKIFYLLSRASGRYKNTRN